MIECTYLCQAVQGIGWWLAEHNIAQLSLNLTDMDLTPMHVAFEEVTQGLHYSHTTNTTSKQLC